MSDRDYYQLVRDLLHAEPALSSEWAAPALLEELKARDVALPATKDDGAAVILTTSDDTLQLYMRHGEAIDMVDWGPIRGVTLTTHRTVVEGGLLLTGYTLHHPNFPRSGDLSIEVSAVAEDELRRILAPFMQSGLPASA